MNIKNKNCFLYTDVIIQTYFKFSSVFYLEIVSKKNEQIRMLETQIEDQKMIVSRFSQLEGEVTRMSTKKETTFAEKITLEETTQEKLKNDVK